MITNQLLYLLSYCSETVEANRGFRRVYLPRPTVLGGAMRDRTADLLNANQALSQLSYGPKNGAG